MQNFDYQTPTRLIFGRGVVDEKLPRVMAQFGKRILLTYGGRSIKRSGLYDKVYALLPDAEITELPGIEPNPKYSTSVVEGVRLCKEKHIDVILSVGGGSVLDCSKAIAAGAKYDGETWDLITRKVKTLAALPIVDIITLAATGSEYDCGGVISRPETHDKIGYLAPTNFPAVSFIDPTYTFTVPPMHTLAGVADCISHIMEQYFYADHIDMNDAFMEGAVRSLCKNVHVVLQNPEDYNARAEIFYACTLGCNGIYALGNSESGWPLHAIEHALSGFYDITHGIGLAIVAPRWMMYILTHTTGDLHAQVVERITSFGNHIWHTDTPEAAIHALYDCYHELGIPMTLPQVGIDASRLPEIAQHIALNEGLDSAWVPLQENDILTILTDYLQEL